MVRLTIRDEASGRTEYFTVEQLGRTQEVTPEGFLLCRDVPVARTGEMFYLPREIGEAVEAGSDGIVRIIRDDAALLRPETTASLNGKAVTLGHPDDDVGPDNWRQLSAGVVQSPRRGEGAGSDLLLADLLITDHEAIKAVREKRLREVSAGYACDYEQIEPGRGRQHNIVFNHVALVEQGRCGSRCSIGDQDMTKKRTGRSWKDRMMTAFRARDEAAMTQLAEEVQDELTDGDEGAAAENGTEHTIVIKVEGPEAAATAADDGEEANADPNEARFAKIEKSIADLAGVVAKLANPGAQDEEADVDATQDEDLDDLEVTQDADEDDTATKDEDGDDDKERTTDSAGLAGEFQDTLARAEILVPGVRLPTLDAKANRKATRDALCLFRRKVLKRALDNQATRGFVEPLLGAKPNFKTMTCDAARTAFIAASELAKAKNNGMAAARAGMVRDSAAKTGAADIAGMNDRNKQFWSGQSK